MNKTKNITYEFITLLFVLNNFVKIYKSRILAPKRLNSYKLEDLRD